MINVCISSLLLIFNLHTRSAGLQGSSLVTAATSISEAKSRISIGGHMDNAESWKQAAFVLHSGKWKGHRMRDSRIVDICLLSSLAPAATSSSIRRWSLWRKHQPASSVCEFLLEKKIRSGFAAMRHDGIGLSTRPWIQ